MNVEKIVREYIDKTVHMSLATVKDNRPWVCEVHFVYDDELNVYFRSLASRRHSQEIALNPSVAGNIVKQHAVGEYPHGIYFEGKAEMLTDEAEIRAVFPLFQARLGADESIINDAMLPEGHKFYRITVTDWHAFGKFGQSSGQKYSMKWKKVN